MRRPLRIKFRSLSVRLSVIAGSLAAIQLAACSSATPTAPPPSPSPSPVPSVTPTPPPSPTAAPDAPSPTTTPASAPTPITLDSFDGLAAVHRFDDLPGEAIDVAFSPDGTILAVALADGSIRLWSVSDGAFLQTLVDHTGPVRSVAFSPDGSLLASGSDDQSVKIWTVGDGSLLSTFNSFLIGRVQRIAISPDGSLLLASGHRCFSEVRHMDTGILFRTLAQPGCVARGEGTVSSWGNAFSPDGDWIITGEERPCCGGSVQRWSAANPAVPSPITQYNLSVRDLVYTPDGTRLAVAPGGSSVIWLIDAVDGRQLTTYEGNTFAVNSVSVSPDVSLLASGGRDRELQLWDLESGELLIELSGHREAINSLEFSPDGSLIATGSDDMSVIIWGLSNP